MYIHKVVDWSGDSVQLFTICLDFIDGVSDNICKATLIVNVDTADVRMQPPTPKLIRYILDTYHYYISI